MKKVSIVIPVYNSDKYLSECLQSILNQTYKNYEIIIINDGSTDRSEDICFDFAQKNESILYKKIENNGVANARNEGLKLATGDYISFVDSDDMVKETYLEEMIVAMKESSCDTVFCKFSILINNDEKPNLEPKLQKYVFGEDSFFERFALPFVEYRENSIMGNIWRSLFSAKIIKENDVKFVQCWAEDMMFLLEYLQYASNVEVVDKYLYLYRFNNESISHKKYFNNLFPSTILALEKMKDLLNKNQILLQNEKDCVYKKLAVKSFFLIKLNELNNPNKENRKKIIHQLANEKAIFPKVNYKDLAHHLGRNSFKTFAIYMFLKLNAYIINDLFLKNQKKIDKTAQYGNVKNV